MIIKTFCFLAVSAALVCPNEVLAKGVCREKLLLDQNWKFTNGDPENTGTLFDYPESELSKQTPETEAKESEYAAKRRDPVAINLGGDIPWVLPGFNDSRWRTVNLPHDWAIETPFVASTNSNDINKGFRQLSLTNGTGTGWYRRTFDIPRRDLGKTVWIEFGGAYRNTLVWLNGRCLGRMESGYTPFHFDVSKFLNYGAKNTLVVRCEAFKNEGWFYEGAGIYRHVWLIKTLPVHVAHWGTYVTSKVSGNAAAVSIETTVENAGTNASLTELTSIIQDNFGTEIAHESSETEIPAGGQVVLKQSLTVPQPKLWSPETPNLYSLVTQTRTRNSLSDEYETPFGIRTAEFTANGFFLNGKKRFIKGVCNHQDFAGVGAAVPDRIQEYRVAMMKEMGCDGWRTSHNPVNEELLDECDRQGMMVVDETRRCGKYAQPMADLKAMMLRDRNHPSVVLWSLGNEEMGIQNTELGAETLKVIQDFAHKLDPSRPCTVAINEQKDDVGFATVVDVVGMNYLKIWKQMDSAHEKYPNRRFIASEEASTLTTRGLYFEDKPKGYLSAYDTYTPSWGSSAEDWWNHFESRPWVAGAFVWTGFDYRGEPTPYAWPCISSHFGILDTCGFPKDNYYYYKAWWTQEPVLHVYPHWNWNQVISKPDAPINVWAQSNCEEAELFINGVSQGRKKIEPRHHVEWSVAYRPGTISVTGFEGGKAVKTVRIETTGPAGGLRLTANRATLKGDGEDVVLVKAEAVDSEGRLVPTANNLVRFEVKGEGKLLGVGNGDPSCHESDLGPERSLFNGLALGIVQASRHPGKITIKATGVNLREAILTLLVAKAAARPAVR